MKDVFKSIVLLIIGAVIGIYGNSFFEDAKTSIEIFW